MSKIASIRSNDRFPSPEFELINLQITVRWHRPESIPGPIVANVLRGALGMTVRKIVCPPAWFENQCHSCPVYTECDYGRVFQPTPKAFGSVLTKQQDAPRPFILKPPNLTSNQASTSLDLNFGIVLFGSAIDSLSTFHKALVQLGKDGMGMKRTPFDIVDIQSVRPDGKEKLLFSGHDGIFTPEKRISQSYLNDFDGQSSRQQLVDDNNGIKSPRLKIDFLTPTYLTTGSKSIQGSSPARAREVRESPPFDVLAGRLRDRISSLCTFFGTRWETDFRGIGELAKMVRLVDSQTAWWERRRQSTRTGHKHEISGLVGTAMYELPDYESLRILYPMLKLGEWIHIGKNAPWGNGAIQVQLQNHA